MAVENDYALILSGGGARGAYQAGGLRALYEICKEADNYFPFRNIVGVSAGAINAAYLASHIHDLDAATANMVMMWRKLTTPEVFRTDYVSVGTTAARLLRGLTLGGFSDKLRPSKTGLLNVTPLRDLLVKAIDFSRIPDHVASGKLNSLCITATDYSTSLGVTFFTGNGKITEWKRVDRLGVRSEIGIDHIMASASIPLFFPPWQVGNRHYGDGCLRNTAPLSPARRIGARKLIVIGVRKLKNEVLDDASIVKPSLGRILSVVINAIFMDAVEVDIERVRIINENLEVSAQNDKFKKIEILYMHPSQAPSELAETRIEGLPPMLRFLISGLGSAHESSEILSYLTFDPLYLNSLVDLGYYDVMKQKENLIQFLRL
jgi:NTE family protein